MIDDLVLPLQAYTVGHKILNNNGHEQFCSICNVSIVSEDITKNTLSTHFELFFVSETTWPVFLVFELSLSK